MQSEPLLAQIDWAHRTEPDALHELMDEPCSFEDWRACLRDLQQVNKITRGYRPTLAFLDRLIAEKKPLSKLRILDVGFGGGDALHRIQRWTKARGVSVELTGIDLNHYAVLVAEERYGSADIQWLSGDAFSYKGHVDVVISSLLTHHLATPTVVRLINWMEQTASAGWFVNDLERSSRSANLFATLSSLMRWHPFVRHDGPVSFARSFVSEDWKQMLLAAGVPHDATQISPWFPSRLCVGRLK